MKFAGRHRLTTGTKVFFSRCVVVWAKVRFRNRIGKQDCMCLGMRPAALTFFDEKNRTLRIAENCRLDFETGLERRSVCVWE